jgi:hypothetical protein
MRLAVADRGRRFWRSRGLVLVARRREACLPLTTPQQNGNVRTVKNLDVSDRVVHDVEDHRSRAAVDGHVSMAGTPTAFRLGSNVEAAAEVIATTAGRDDPQTWDLAGQPVVTLVGKSLDQLSGEARQNVNDEVEHARRLGASVERARYSSATGLGLCALGRLHVLAANPSTAGGGGSRPKSAACLDAPVEAVTLTGRRGVARPLEGDRA